MPSQKQQLSYPGYSTEQLLQIAYGTFLELGWNPKYAGPNAIIGYTPRSWNKYDDEIVVGAGDEILIVTSSLVHNESFDLMGKNKKHIRDFMIAFEKVKSLGSRAEWQEHIEKLRQQTAETVTEQTKKAEEVNKVMNFPGSNLYATYAIIAINVIVFAIMVFNGVNFFAPNGYDIIVWGGNFSPLTLTGDWWRLITCVFVHIGIVHLAFNMYALYMAGVYLEPMLGKIKYLVAYLCTGIFASIASLFWHNEPVPSAGASGAIFGMYGVFIALLLTNLIPRQMRMALLQSIGVFVVFNLVYGMRSGIDNAAHVGGLLSGILIGFIFYFLLKQQTRVKQNLAILGIMTATILTAWLFLHNQQKKLDPQIRNETINQIKEATYPDSEKFSEMYNEVLTSDEKIVDMMNDGVTSYSEWISKNETNVNKELEVAANIINKMKKYDVSEKSKSKLNLFEQLLGARKEYVSIFKQLSQEDNASNQLGLAEIKDKQRQIVEELNKQN